jgi:hypothetical protein
MGMDLTGINNCNEYYTNHYFSSIFEENAEATISAWRNLAKESEEIRTPWSLLRENSKQYYIVHEKYLRIRSESQMYSMIRDMADQYLKSLGYPTVEPFTVEISEKNYAPIYLEVKKPNGAPLLWVMLAYPDEQDSGIMQGWCFHAEELQENDDDISVTTMNNEELATKILYSMAEPPRWILFIGLNQIALIDRSKWNEKRCLQFDLEDIFSRREESTLQAMSVLLHQESLCPDDGVSLLDKLDENSHRHSSAVSQDLKFALREAIELLGNEVLYDMTHRLGKNIDNEPVDAAKLSEECLIVMYRMLFLLFIEARPELGYAPMKSLPYVQGYSLESLRDVVDTIREETSEVGDGFYLHETIAKLYEMVYTGYPEDEVILKELAERKSLHDVFYIEPLKAHIFDPEYTPMITAAKLRNSIMLKIVELMSITRSTGRRNDRRGRISYAALGINQMGAVYEALLSYRGFIAENTLFEVKREKDSFNELDVGYFVPEIELDNYSEEERVRYPDGKLRKYEKGTFIYRLAGREREKSASYYTPEVLTKCLVKYSLKELLEGKSADDILQLTVCEPAMGSAAFLNEAINQLSEAYLDKKQKELGETISYQDRTQELQRVKMYIADRNVYGIDLNPIAVELAEVSLWLNTIYKGGFVPWFGTQLVNGNSLIGARRQCYRFEQLRANRVPGIWYDNAPERIMPGEKRMPRKQVYHFLTGDPGMSNYTDTVIKELAPDKIQSIKNWNRDFVHAYNEEEILTLLHLSATIDSLWAKQVELRKDVRERTADALSVYGHTENMDTTRTTIREKDLIYKRLYKSEEMKNAGPYARLKAAMDYWCALWFWPIDNADLLPSRSEFLFDMSLILEGGIVSVTKESVRQLSMFPSKIEEMASEISATYKDMAEVDLQALCERNPRLKLSKEIAMQNRFLHWELEFADLFDERGGFDLLIGNPPWIKIEWNEQAVLSDCQPMFMVQDFTATQITHKRNEALSIEATRATYFSEYVAMSATQNFLGAVQNYYQLNGAINLFKCFLPQAWQFCGKSGVSAFIHPDGVYDDPRGGALREELYPRLRKHFQFLNEMKLFAEVHHNTMFSLNVYCNAPCASFDTISNLFDVSTIEQCYDDTIQGSIPGIKDENNNWNTNGHPNRVVHIGRKELELFAKLFDGSENWKQARLPAIHAQKLLGVLSRFAVQKNTLSTLQNEVFGTELLNETTSQKDGIIQRNVHFPEKELDMIYSGPHIGLANPMYKSSRRECKLNSDFDNIDLNVVSHNSLQRCNYSIACKTDRFIQKISITPWGEKYHSQYKIVTKLMVGADSERTLAPCIIPRQTSHIDTIYGITFKDKYLLAYISGIYASLPYDFFIKSTKKRHIRWDIVSSLPVLENFPEIKEKIVLRSLSLNCITDKYCDLWEKCFHISWNNELWAKNDFRLLHEHFACLTREWTWETPLRTDYERRQTLVEIDVLTSMALGMTLDQLKTIYRIQFPVLQSYENDTWYDQKGRIAFSSKNMGDLTYKRSEWNDIKNAMSGTFSRIISDDTMPGGPVERTIEYVAPFDRCDREQDYDTAWAFFEKRFKDQ